MKIFFIVLGITFCLSTYLYAGESFSFSVSCTIPAIPGVNAPPLEEKKEENNTPSYTEKSEDKPQRQQSTFLIQEEKKENLLVKTIYPK